MRSSSDLARERDCMRGRTICVWPASSAIRQPPPPPPPPLHIPFSAHRHRHTQTHRQSSLTTCVCDKLLAWAGRSAPRALNAAARERARRATSGAPLSVYQARWGRANMLAPSRVEPATPLGRSSTAVSLLARMRSPPPPCRLGRKLRKSPRTRLQTRHPAGRASSGRRVRPAPTANYRSHGRPWRKWRTGSGCARRLRLCPWPSRRRRWRREAHATAAAANAVGRQRDSITGAALRACSYRPGGAISARWPASSDLSAIKKYVPRLCTKLNWPNKQHTSLVQQTGPS
jgi:hypothetical protein